MKKILSLLFIMIGVLTINSASAQVIHFKAYRGANGVAATNVVGSYSWGPWAPQGDDITIDLTHSNIFLGKKTYEIIEKPKKWIIKKDLKYVSISCADNAYNKVNVKLYQYDKGEFRIYFMDEKRASRYSVTYLE
jgi:hypothetical protein